MKKAAVWVILAGLVLVIGSGAWIYGILPGSPAQPRGPELEAQEQSGAGKENSRNPLTDALPEEVFFRDQQVTTSTWVWDGESVDEYGQAQTNEAFTYTILDVRSSKEPAPFSIQDVTFYNSQGKDGQDENGTLTKNRSYLFVRLTIESHSDRRALMGINSMMVLTLPGSDYAMSNEEMRIIDNRQNPVEGKDTFKYFFEPVETGEFTVGFIVDDASLTDPGLVLRIGGTGTTSDNGSTRFIKLNQTSADASSSAE